MSMKDVASDIKTLLKRSPIYPGYRYLVRLKENPPLYRLPYYPQFQKILSRQQIESAQIYSTIVGLLTDNQENGAVVRLAQEYFNGEDFLADMIKLVKVRAERHDSTYDSADESGKFIDRIKSMPPGGGGLDTSQWKSLSCVANSLGLCQIGYALRQKAVGNLYDKRTRTNTELCDLFLAAMDVADYRTAQHIIYKRFFIRKFIYSVARNAKLYLLLFTDYPEYMRMARKLYKSEDQEFAEYVKGKRVAIVGPAQTNLKSGNEIDSYDIVVRFNYGGKDKIGNREYVGSKTNVTYHGGRRSGALRKMQNTEFLMDLDWMVLKIHTESKKLNIKNVKERGAHRHMWLPFMGVFNKIQLTVLDLLMFEPEEIKIFNTNFWLGSKLYHENYTAGVFDDNSIIRSNAIHDQTTQINLIRNLWNSGLIKVDNELAAILMMKNEDIAKKYDDLYQYNLYSGGI